LFCYKNKVGKIYGFTDLACATGKVAAHAASRLQGYGKVATRVATVPKGLVEEKHLVGYDAA
jgi:hypothetical protein